VTHHHKPRPRLNSCAKFINRTIIKRLDLAALFANYMVVVMCIIRMRWFIPRIPLRKVDSAGKALRLKEVHKAIRRDKIDGFWIRLGSDKFVGCCMQLNHRLRSLRLGEGCH
jgi:hypothetical protein